MPAASARLRSRSRFALASFALVLASGLAGPACVPPPPPSSRVVRVYKGTPELLGNVRLDAARGELVLELAPGRCVAFEDRVYPDGHMARASRPCSGVDWSKAQVVAPWGQRFPATSGSLERITFKIDWAGTGLDALASDDPPLLHQPWTIRADDSPRTLSFIPDASARRTMLTLIGDATDTQITVGEVSAPPQIVAEIRFSAELRDGTANDILVSVTNKGKGDAYRLSAITHSPVTALHGLRFSFGRLRAGETKTRRVHFQLPRNDDETEALIVLDFDEAHRYAPSQTSQRYPLKKASDLAVFVLDCHFDDLAGDPPRVDAGATVHLGCVVRNDGAPARAVQVHASYEERPYRIDAPVFDLGTDRASRVTLPLEVPRDATMDARLTIHIDVADAAGAHAQALLHLEVARPQLCPEGRISHERFLVKRAELRRKLDAGLIGKDDYDRYEAELVGCMKTE